MEGPGHIQSPPRPPAQVSPTEHPLAPWSPASSPSPFLSLSILISIRLSIRLSHNPVPLTPPVPQSAHAPGGRRTFRRSLIRPENRPPPSPPFPVPRGFRSPGNPGTCRLIHRRLLPHHTSADGSPALPFARPRPLRLHPGEPVPYHHPPPCTPAEGRPVEPIVPLSQAGNLYPSEEADPAFPHRASEPRHSPRRPARQKLLPAPYPREVPGQIAPLPGWAFLPPRPPRAPPPPPSLARCDPRTEESEVPRPTLPDFSRLRVTGSLRRRSSPRIRARRELVNPGKSALPAGAAAAPSVAESRA